MEPGKRNRRAGVWVLLTAAALVAADQITKHYILLYLKPAGTTTVISGLLEFSYLENTGVAFGLLQDKIWFVSATTILAFAVILFLLFRYRRHTFFSYASCALLLAGGLGNLVDRFRFGFVVDFIHVLFFGYVFNVADCCITVGAVLFAIHYLFFTGKEKKTAESGEETGEDHETAGEEAALSESGGRPEENGTGQAAACEAVTGPEDGAEDHE